MATAADRPPSPEEDEVEIWWGGPALRSLLPSFLACIAATFALIGLAIYFKEDFGLPADPVRYAVYILAAFWWAIQLTRWGFRMVGVNYRLTTRRIYCWTGLHAAPDRPIDLIDVIQVHVEQTWLERLLAVGRLRIIGHHGEQTLWGLTNPRRIAALVEHRVKEAKHA